VRKCRGPRTSVGMVVVVVVVVVLSLVDYSAAVEYDAAGGCMLLVRVS
jgi:hypothetical protein